jgi:hydrophobe/amphiphile efflux-3 (HAE3) family protein
LIAGLINGRKNLVVLAVIAVGIILLLGTTQLSMDTSDDANIDKNTARGMMLDHYVESFSSDAIILIVEADDVATHDILVYLDHLEDDIRNERSVASVYGLPDLIRSASGGALPASVAGISSAIDAVPPDALKFIYPSPMMTIVGITLEPGTSSEVQKQMLGIVETLLTISDPPPGVVVSVSGNAAFEKQMGDEIGSSLGILILAAMLLMVLAVGCFFSHMRHRLLPVAVVACGLAATFGAMGLLGIPISMTVVGAFPVLIGIGIDYAIQYHSRLDEECRSAPLGEAILTTLRSSGPSILLAMVATALGFVAMFASPIPSIQDFGFICTLGVALCYIAATVLVPLFAAVTRYQPKVRQDSGGAGRMAAYDRFLGNIAEKIARNPVPIILILGCIAIVGFEMDESVPVSTDENTFVPSDMPALLDMKKVTRTMGPTMTLPVFITADSVLDPRVLEWMAAFEAYELERNERITGARGINTLLTAYNGGILPETEREIEAVLSRIPESETKPYLNGRMEAVIEFSTVEMEGKTAKSVLENVKKDLAWFMPPPGVSATLTGTMEMGATMIQEIEDGKTFMTVLGFVLIFAFLLLVYRKFRAITPLIPIVMIVGWNGAIMYLLGIDYTPLTAVLGSMTIGVASEYTILIMERCEEELAAGGDIYTAIRTSVQKIGTAVTISGLTTVFGFSALILSPFNIISNFGLVTVLTVGFSLVGAIMVMPAVLALMGRRKAPVTA